MAKINNTSLKASNFGLRSDSRVEKWLNSILLIVNSLTEEQAKSELKVFTSTPKEWEAKMDSHCEAPFKGYEDIMNFMLYSGALNSNKLDGSVDGFTAIFRLYSEIYGKAYAKMLNAYVS